MKQIEELLEIAMIEKTILKHVKPHGSHCTIKQQKAARLRMQLV